MDVRAKRRGVSEEVGWGDAAVPRTLETIQSLAKPWSMPDKSVSASRGRADGQCWSVCGLSAASITLHLTAKRTREGAILSHRRWLGVHRERSARAWVARVRLSLLGTRVAVGTARTCGGERV